MPASSRLTATATTAATATSRSSRTSTSSSSTATAALFRAVLDAPKDEAAVSVLADALMEVNDPRGELISLQLAVERGEGTVETAKRIDALLKKHKKEWIGALAPVTYRARFRRGFLDELELHARSKASAQGWAEHVKDPQLATVTSIIGKATAEIVAQFIASGSMRSLRTVNVESDVIADALEATRPSSIEELLSFRWHRGRYDERFTERVIPLLETLPNVTSLGCYSSMLLEHVMKKKECDALFQRLKRLDVPEDENEAGFALAAKLPSHITSFKWTYCGEIERLSSKKEEERDGWVFRARVEKPEELDIKRHPYGLPALFPHLVKLKGLARVEITTPLENPDLSRAALLKKKGIAVEVRRVPPPSGRVTI
jgi:uncharacterized protein (TIGR02996 family)